jgi:hypothetical protein
MPQSGLPPAEQAGGQVAVNCHEEWRSADNADRFGVQAPRPLAFLVAGVSEPERHSRVRELRALSALLFGSRHEITVALSVAVADLDATDPALRLLHAAPALPKRRLLATFGRLNGGLKL